MTLAIIKSPILKSSVDFLTLDEETPYNVHSIGVFSSILPTILTEIKLPTLKISCIISI